MNWLLDTQLYLWYVAASPRLSKSTLRTIQQADVVYVSAASSDRIKNGECSQSRIQDSFLVKQQVNGLSDSLRRYFDS
jgi:PIN domain nuclease of toxin-antitoxin system